MSRESQRQIFLSDLQKNTLERSKLLVREGQAGVSKAAEFAFVETDRIIHKIDMDAIERRLKGESIPLKACQKGCGECCGHRVIVTPIEAIAAFRWIQTNWSEEQISELKQRARVYKEDFAKGLPDWSPIPCPMVIEGSCSIYAARPVTCRVHHSFDVELCREGLRGKSSKPMPQFEDLLILVSPIIDGLRVASGGYRVVLGLAIAAFLEDPELINRWLAGESNLEEARDDELVRRAERAYGSKKLPTK